MPADTATGAHVRGRFRSGALGRERAASCSRLFLAAPAPGLQDFSMPTPSRPVVSVLVADDDESERVLIQHILQSADGVRHRVTTVPDGRSALSALREQVFDVAPSST